VDAQSESTQKFGIRWFAIRKRWRRFKEDSTMEWLTYVAYFFGAAFLVNAIPHFVSGVMGRPFQSPFAKPHGVGLSSSRVNVLWGAFNAAVGYVLVVRVGAFDLHNSSHVIAVGAGGLLMGLMSAHLFGKFHGGDLAG
jgi:hypothetical protein